MFPSIFMFKFPCFLFVSFCNFTLSSMSKSWLRLVVLKWSPQHLSTKKSIPNAVCDKQVGFRCRSWKFGVQVRNGGYQGTPIAQKIPIFLRFLSVSHSAEFKFFSHQSAPHYKMGSCWLCGSECGIFNRPNRSNASSQLRGLC